MIISCSLTLAGVDLISRPLLKKMLYYRPHEMFINRWPPLPSLSRYDKNISYDGDTYGDLAAVSGVPDYRETRPITFKTDAFGFRNDKMRSTEVIDLILLGDSFGVGNGTSQEKIWSTILTDQYGVHTYNLSIPGSPWHELMNLKIEFNRLRTHERTIVLWAIFTGNDLDERFRDQSDPSPFRNAFGRGVVSVTSFIKRSPIRRLLKRLDDMYMHRSPSVIVADFLNNRPVLFLPSYVQKAGRTVESIVHHRNYGRLKMVFDEMKTFAESKHVAVAVTVIPTKVEVYPWVLNEDPPWDAKSEPSGFSVAVRELSEAEGFPFLDLKPFLIDEAKRVFVDSGDLLWWYDDTHWNDKGHEVVAKIVYENLLVSGEERRDHHRAALERLMAGGTDTAPDTEELAESGR